MTERLTAKEQQMLIMFLGELNELPQVSLPSCGDI